MDKQELIDALLGLLAIESVADLQPEGTYPYGPGPARALAYVLDLCQRMGIRTENRDGRVAWAEIGQGEELVAVLVHLDVVPVGEGWTHDPRGEVCGERLYGRGAVDDKGPVMAALFAMKELQDDGVPLRRRVRLIFGQSEETGIWDDMEYYKVHEQLPVFGFTPDAEFPAIYGEKGLLNYELTLPLKRSGLLSIEGGDVPNMVPAWARAVVPGPEGPVTYEARGRAAHASTPEQGENAISALMARLAAAGVESPLVEFYNRHIGYDLHGERMGCAFSDEQSGKLTLNAGLLRVVDDRVVLTLDIRNPVTFTEGQVRRAIEAACLPFRIGGRCARDTPPIYLDQNGRVIRSMVEIYRQVTGDNAPPAVIGGGTYARAMPGIAAFGPMRPGRECTEHQRDEYILLEDLYQAEEIYRRVMERLANLKPEGGE